MRRFMSELRFFPQKGPSLILTDSLAATRAVEKLSHAGKHMAVYLAYLREKFQEQEIQIQKIVRDENVADLFTRQSQTKEYQRLVQQLFDPLRLDFLPRGPCECNGRKKTQSKQERSSSDQPAVKQTKGARLALP